MPVFWADPAGSQSADGIRFALTGFADEICATVARIFLYVGALALLAIAGVHGWDQLQAGDGREPAAKAAWKAADRSSPAFAVSKRDPSEKSSTYEIFRHPAGGRKDIMRWAGAGIIRPAAELEIYRPGGEFDPKIPPGADLVRLMAETPAQNAGIELEAAGIVDSKFGAVALLRPTGASDGVDGCLGFAKRIDQPRLEIAGFSCQDGAPAARRMAIACLLNRLTLLNAANDPKLADWFAKAELQAELKADLRRSDCQASSTSDRPSDWISSSDAPGLKGAL
jgi:hypothetical protein